jgi:allophanate hydrolase
VADALLRVLRAGPLTSVQDRGRPGFARYGVTDGGPTDRTAHRIGHALAGNPPTAAAGIEVDIQGVSLLCLSGAVRFAFTGGDFRLTLADLPATGWLIAELREGQQLDIAMNRWGNWCYIAFAGDIEATQWLGSKSVNPGWAVSGSTLKAGDEILIRGARHDGQAFRRIPVPVFARPSPMIRVVPGPQERFFAPETFRHFYGESFAISSQYNRQGIRLDGPPLAINASLDMPSEPVARGAIQVDGSGQASALMADHHTTGGYPKIATVITADQDGLAQLRPRQRLRFLMTTPEEGIARLRQQEARLEAYLEALLR